ncbi:MAG TPA: hypothetical protein VKP03_00150 [Patescibacteria group bacterium]|nr:hypothetical protein [Patescibacteria group bacterium]
MILILLEGMALKIIASFDDVISRIPLIATVTKRKKGAIAFSIGNILAISLAMVLAYVFGSFLQELPYTKYITSGLIVLLALSVQFDALVISSRKKVDKKIKKIKKLSWERLGQLTVIGFVVSFVTILDDIIVLIPLFLRDGNRIIFSVLGIYLATIIQILAVIYFGQKLYAFKYKKQVAVFSLLILAILIVFNIL